MERVKLYQFTATDEYSRLRFFGACDGRSTYTSSSDFLKKAVKLFNKESCRYRMCSDMQRIKFANHFSQSKLNLTALFEYTAMEL